jgi:hypothetical protein
METFMPDKGQQAGLRNELVTPWLLFYTQTIFTVSPLT